MLASVSEVDCFLRSRCSMEMWCPGDIGRDSWDWVGPPACEKACFNSPEWGGGSSPVKTEPLQIVLLLLLFLTQGEKSPCVCPQDAEVNCATSDRTPVSQDSRRLRHPGEPSTTHSCESSSPLESDGTPLNCLADHASRTCGKSTQITQEFQRPLRLPLGKRVHEKEDGTRQHHVRLPAHQPEERQGLRGRDSCRTTTSQASCSQASKSCTNSSNPAWVQPMHRVCKGARLVLWASSMVKVPADTLGPELRPMVLRLPKGCCVVVVVVVVVDGQRDGCVRPQKHHDATTVTETN